MFLLLYKPTIEFALYILQKLCQKDFSEKNNFFSFNCKQKKLGKESDLYLILFL